jgi:hypothetical protein
MSKLTDVKKQMVSDFNQDQFRKQAQRRIDITKQRLSPYAENSFADMQERAWDKAFKKMRDMGIYDFDKNLLKGTEEEANEIFKIYFETYLNNEKTPPDRATVLTKGILNSLIEEKRI